MVFAHLQWRAEWHVRNQDGLLWSMRNTRDRNIVLQSGKGVRMVMNVRSIIEELNIFVVHRIRLQCPCHHFLHHPRLQQKGLWRRRKPTQKVNSNYNYHYNFLYLVCPTGRTPYLLNGAPQKCTISRCPAGYECTYRNNGYHCCSMANKAGLTVAGTTSGSIVSKCNLSFSHVLATLPIFQQLHLPTKRNVLVATL